MVFWNCPIIPHNRSVKNKHQNTTERLTVLGQFCKLIPKYSLAKVCAELNKEGIKIAARAFSVWSHIVSMIYCHMAHCISLNDICDGLQNFKGNLNDIRNATAPHRNTLSHANRTRDIALIKKLFWKTLEYYQQTHPNFFTQGARSYFRLPRRFKRAIRAIDSTTIELIAKCMDWAKHRKHKAAAKVHVALDLISFIPIRVVTDSANHHDGSYMSELCGNMKSGDIAVMDRAYVDYKQLDTLTEQGVFWVTRSKSNMKVKVIRELNKGRKNTPQEGKEPHYPIILKDEEVELTGKTSHKRYPRSFRHVSAIVPDSNGKEITVSFLSEWKRDFKHFFTLMKGALWAKRTVRVIVSRYGTAGESPPERHAQLPSDLPGINWAMLI